MITPIYKREGIINIIIENNIEKLELHESKYLEKPITVLFSPIIEMDENECIKFIKKNLNNIKITLSKIINKNNHFYKHFSEAKIDEGAFSFGLHRKLNHNEEILIVNSCQIYVTCNYKTIPSP